MLFFTFWNMDICFIEIGASIKSKEKMETNSSLYSCDKCHLQIVNWKWLYIEAKQKAECFPSCLYDHRPIVKYLIGKEANIETKGRN